MALFVGPWQQTVEISCVWGQACTCRPDHKSNYEIGLSPVTQVNSAACLWSRTDANYSFDNHMLEALPLSCSKTNNLNDGIFCFRAQIRFSGDRLFLFFLFFFQIWFIHVRMSCNLQPRHPMPSHAITYLRLNMFPKYLGMKCNDVSEQKLPSGSPRLLI